MVTGSAMGAKGHRVVIRGASSLLEIINHFMLLMVLLITTTLWLVPGVERFWHGPR